MSATIQLGIAVCDTGPLISMLQSSSLDVGLTRFGHIHIPQTCVVELQQHGWQEMLERTGAAIIRDTLTREETLQANAIAQRIAAHPASKEPVAANHQGEAEAMVLAQRADMAANVLLLDERAARAVAAELALHISGFAGVLLLAVSAGMLSADDVKQRLERCQEQGTHYGGAFIERVYQTARERML